MPIHQQLRSLEYSVVEAVASLLRGVIENCLVGIQSHCPDKVDDIKAVRSLQQISVTVLINFCFLRINEKDISFSLQETPTLTISFRESGPRMVQPLW